MALFCVVCAPVVAVAAGVGGAATPANVTRAAIQLKPAQGKSVQGFAYFKQRGARVTGYVAVWGLPPNSEHAVHIHGPNGFCGRAPADPVAAHADLRSDASGVAFTSVSMRSGRALLRRGFYYNVHEGPATTAGKNPEIACGDIRPE